MTIDRPAVRQIVDRRAGAGVEAAARFMAAEQRAATRSRRLSAAVTHESGRDSRGWFARAGMGESAHQRGPAWFWYFEEFQTGRGGGVPFIRQSLFGHTRQVARLMTGRG